MPMKTKSNAAIVMSILAFALSLFASVRTEWRAADDKRRAVRTQLTDVLARLTSLQLENAKLTHDAQDDQLYLQIIGNALNQQNGFLLDQAFYLADQVSSLVTTYEYNTIASAAFAAGDVLATERYHRRAIEVAHSDLYRAQATRAYAVFLFTQRRFAEGRDHFNRALLAGSDALSHATNGQTYQIWAWDEQHLALAPEDAKGLWDKARTEFNGIDIEIARNSLLAQLAVAQDPASTNPPASTFAGSPPSVPEP
jgi:tetratricopeptide (TPR) repeat protein